MKLNFPKIVHPIDLGEYDSAMQGQQVFAWVNPPSKKLIEMGELHQKLSGQDAVSKEDETAFLKNYADLLSQAEDKKTHISLEDLREVIEETKDTDPRFWHWFQVRILDEINSHRIGLKKDSNPPRPPSQVEAGQMKNTL